VTTKKRRGRQEKVFARRDDDECVVVRGHEFYESLHWFVCVCAVNGNARKEFVNRALNIMRCAVKTPHFFISSGLIWHFSISSV